MRLGLFLSLLMGCAASGTAPRWESKHFRSHPLVGKIYDVRAEGFVSKEVLRSSLIDAKIVLLGEAHDNRDHHLLQKRWIEEISVGGKEPGVTLEMLDTTDQVRIDKVWHDPKKSAREIVRDLGLKKRGWDEKAYLPVLEAARERGLPLYGGNVPHAMTQGMAGSQDILSVHFPGIRLPSTWTEEERTQLEDQIVDSHCGFITREQASPMLTTQRARDAVMAFTLFSKGKERGGILIAGNEHVRKDVGVPRYLALYDSNLTVLSLSHQEVVEGRNSPSDYPLAYDYVFFTPRADVKDPCEKYRHSLERSLPRQ